MEREFGPYTLIKQIAVGGMAEIQLARTEGIAGFEKYVAIKMIHPNLSEDEQFIQMLIDEAKITVQLTHVNIAQTFDLGRVGGTYYITMEFVEGCDLYKLLRMGSELEIDTPVNIAAFIAKEAATGLDYAHRKCDVMGDSLGIIHRDVSPQNLLVSSVGEVKVIDFGIAKATMRAQQTEVGVIKGKYYYMSPEQSWGEHLDARTDIFSTGIILYELLTGQMLYLEEDLHTLLDMVRNADIAPPSTLRRDIPPQLEAIVMKALAKRPNDRYSTAGEMAADLERFLHKHSPLFNASTMTAWTSQILAEEVPGVVEVVQERDLRSVTQGLGPGHLLSPEDEFSDENSIIFRVDEQEARMRAEELENEERDIDQETGIVDSIHDSFDIPIPSITGARALGDSTRAISNLPPSGRPPILDNNTPLPELYPDSDIYPDEGEGMSDNTVVSAPPGFGGARVPGGARTPGPPGFIAAATMASPMPSMESKAPSQQSRKPPQSRPIPTLKRPPKSVPKRPVAPKVQPPSSDFSQDDFESEQTIAQQGIPARPGRLPKAVPSKPAAQKSTANSDWQRSNALTDSNPKPAVSALKPSRKSRKTPPKGIPASPSTSSSTQSSVLTNLLTNTGRAQVALSDASHTNSAVPLSPTTEGTPIDMRAAVQAAPPQQQPPQAPRQQTPQQFQQQQPPQQQQQQQQYPPQQQQYQQQQQQQQYPPQQQQQQYQQPQQQYQQPQQYQHPQQKGWTAAPPDTLPPGAQGFTQLPPGYMARPGQQQQSFTPGGGFPQVPGLATSAKLAMEVDELPEEYRLSGGSSRAKWIFPVIGFIALAVAAAAAAYFLLTDDTKTGGETTTITIVSSPEGGAVSVDGKLLAEKTPTQFEDAIIGEAYEIAISYKGYKGWEKKHTVGGRGETVTARLDEILVTLTITSSPSGADIFVNGNKSAAGTTPLVLEDMVPDTLTNIEIKLDGYQPATRRLDWKGTDTKTENFNLKR